MDGLVREWERRVALGDMGSAASLGRHHFRMEDYQKAIDVLAPHYLHLSEDVFDIIAKSISELCKDTPIRALEESTLDQILTTRLFGREEEELCNLLQIPDDALFDSLSFDLKSVAHMLYKAGETLLPVWWHLRATQHWMGGDVKKSQSPDSMFMNTASTDMVIAVKDEKVKFAPRAATQIQGLKQEMHRGYGNPFPSIPWYAFKRGGFEALQGPVLPLAYVTGNSEGYLTREKPAAARDLGWLAACEGRKEVYQSFVEWAFEERRKSDKLPPIFSFDVNLPELSETGGAFPVLYDAVKQNLHNNSWVRRVLTTYRHRFHAVTRGDTHRERLMFAFSS